MNLFPALKLKIALAAFCFTAATLKAADVQVFFSPHGGCTDAIVRELNAATNVVLVQAYSFTSAPIAAALVAAHKRGVTVRVTCWEIAQSENSLWAGRAVAAAPPSPQREKVIFCGIMVRRRSNAALPAIGKIISQPVYSSFCLFPLLHTSYFILHTFLNHFATSTAA